MFVTPMFIVVPVNGSSIFGILNDVIVIVLASIASYYISKAVAKSSIKSVISAFSVKDLINIAKQLIENASKDEELKKNINIFVSNMVKAILSNEDLRNSAKAVIKGILEDPEVRSEAKKVINDIVSQYPVLARLLGVKNGEEEKTRRRE